ncbi:MAG: hypothetical protein WC178_03475 [Candidatus Paceibacterota bacterium]|jgi:hypothetical protein
MCEAKNHISKVSKLDGIKSWSLQAMETCPGAKNDDGSLVLACQGCYATTGNYRFLSVKKTRAENKQAWESPEWVELMVSTLQNDRYFRWFDSGDMYSYALAEKIYEVMVKTPWCNHWLPTRMNKFNKFVPLIEKMNSLNNVVVRFSSDSITGQYIGGLHGSVIIPETIIDKNVFVCKASENKGQCSGCRACWTKSVKVIGYRPHGKKMEKVLRNL